MDWYAPIDGYCERLGPGFWAEPLNAVTNAAFIVAAVLAFTHAVHRRALDLSIGLLILLMLAIGIGSFLFHTYAVAWASLADVVPIGLFIVAYLFFALRRLAGLSGWFALSVTLNYVAAAALGARLAPQFVPAVLGGSSAYLPPLLGLTALGLLLFSTNRRQAGRLLLTGAAVFSVSLTLRTIDGPLCASIPFGTHFLWHALNAALLGGLVMVLTRYGHVVGRKR